MNRLMDNASPPVTLPQQPGTNSPVIHPPPEPMNGEEPPPLPSFQYEDSISERWRAFQNQPKRLPFWWHQTVRAQEIAHWNRMFDRYQFSSAEFYDRMEKTFSGQKIPQLKLSRVFWKEAGLLSADRLYLRLSWKRYVGDICAAPFGRGFFFSFWVFVLPPVLSLCHITGMIFLFLIAGLVFGQSTGIPPPQILPLCLMPLVPLLALWLRYSRQVVNEEPVSDFILGLTILGPFIDVIFRPLTYFQRDTAAMFTAFIEQSFFELVDEVTKVEGIRPLTDLEKTPQRMDLFNLQRMRRK